MKKINFGMIGTGEVTEKKSGPAFWKLPNSNLYSVMSIDEEQVKDYAKRHGIERYTTDYLEIFEDPNVDAVYIATPPASHHFYALEAAKHGKAVYVEKPMGMTVEECKEMIEVCEKYNVPLFTAYYRRGQEKFVKVKDLIDTKALGEVRSFNLRFSLNKPEVTLGNSWRFDKKVSGGGMLFDMGIHIIDILLYLFGDVKQAIGLSSNQSDEYTVNDNTSAIIEFKNGVHGTLQFTFNGHQNEDELTIIGSEGTLVFPVLPNDPVKFYNAEGMQKLVFEELEHVQMPFIEKVINTLLGEDDVESKGHYGLRAQEILETLENNTTIEYD